MDGANFGSHFFLPHLDFCKQVTKDKNTVHTQAEVNAEENDEKVKQVLFVGPLECKGGSNLISYIPCQGLFASLSVFILSPLSPFLSMAFAKEFPWLQYWSCPGRKRSDIIEHLPLDFTFLVTSGVSQLWIDEWFFCTGKWRPSTSTNLVSGSPSLHFSDGNQTEKRCQLSSFQAL